MKFKINAGAELDLLTRDEMRDELAGFAANWRAETIKGDRYKRIYGYGTPATGAVEFGGDLAGGEQLGPAQGFVWDVRRLGLLGHDPAADVLRVFINAPEIGNCVIPVMGRYQGFNRAELVLYPGDLLLVSGTTAATDRVSLVGQVRELPIGLAWRL